jgi:hypothetical protein
MKGGAPLLGARPGQSGPFGPYGGGMLDAEDVEFELLVVPDCPTGSSPPSGCGRR